jgi:hypothetical protein
MENIIVVKRDMDLIIAMFPRVIKKDKQMLLKRLNGRKFDLKSVDSFNKSLALPEHEHYFVSGEFINYRYETHVKYKIRANSTFQLLAFVVPLMALPALIFVNTGDKLQQILDPNYPTKALLSIVLYLVLVGISTFVYFSQNKKLKAKGALQFEELISRLEKSPPLSITDIF